MRTVAAAAAAALLCSLQLTSSTQALHNPDCCSKLTHMKIPLRQVKSYSVTSSDCPLKAVVFYTKKGLKFCVDRDADWVKVPADGAVGVEVEGHQVFWTCDNEPLILVLTTVPPHTGSLGVSTKTKAGLVTEDDPLPF
ncbi:hypothetical protein NFI96_027639 [Prochilodus magdalenae]|nr:hypothetical protein NFI96_027639 [Prochilodus magdalenae]